jgi:Ribonuclease G/E
MGKDLIILDKLNGNEAAILFNSNGIEDSFFTLINDEFLTPGNIYLAIVDRIVKGQAGVFIKLPDAKRGFLRNSKNLKPGKRIIVQVTGYPDEGKAIPLTDRLIFKGRAIIITPFAKGINFSHQIKSNEEKSRILDCLQKLLSNNIEFGIIVRSVAINVNSEEIIKEARALISSAERVFATEGKSPELLARGMSAHELALREWQKTNDIKVINGGFKDYSIIEQLESLLDPRLESGLGTIFIESTKALIAVDVNTGKDFSTASGLKANLNLARLLSKQLRLRGLGGQIVLDLAPMPKRDRKLFEVELKKAFKADPVDTTLVGWTPLGHYEIQRKRERVPLESVLKS